MRIIIVQGYGGNVLMFKDPQNEHTPANPIWCGRLEDKLFRAAKYRIRTETAKGPMNAREIKRYFRISPRLKNPYDWIALDDDKGILGKH